MSDATTTTKAAPAGKDLGDRYGSGANTAKITVRMPCTCGGPWWRCWRVKCPGAEQIAVYECEGFAEAPLSPLPFCVEYVRARHPHAEFLYLR